MIICAQCSGYGAARGNNQIQNASPTGLYAETLQPGGSSSPSPVIPCTQCNGKGYQTGGSF